MNWAWTWSGRCFGYWIGDDLWTYRGKHIGHSISTDIYSPSGRYIGETMGNGRLITNKSKAGVSGPCFVPTPPRDHEPRLPDDAGNLLYMGYGDFPHPDGF
jgi:hypothetical protein